MCVGIYICVYIYIYIYIYISIYRTHRNIALKYNMSSVTFI
jgi:hypothetical protein